MNKLTVNNTKDPACLSGAAVSSKAAAHKLDSVTSSTKKIKCATVHKDVQPDMAINMLV